MAKAYRHQGLGSTKQVKHFVEQRIRELRDLIEKSQTESEMLRALVARGPDLPASFTSYTQKRLGKLDERLRSDRNEKAMWHELLDSLPLCVNCKGYGETQYQDYDDSVRSRDCQACGGTGEGAGSASAPPL